MRQSITERQMELYAFIRQFIIQNGLAPTIREMQDAFGISSSNGIRQKLLVLVRKGWLRCQFRVHRGITLVDDEWKHDVESLEFVEEALGIAVNYSQRSAREMDIAHAIGTSIREELTYARKATVRPKTYGLPKHGT